MIRWLNTVKFDKLHPAMNLALMRIEKQYDAIATECWITSGNDGVHKEDSKHYLGKALDFRTHNITGISQETIEIKKSRLITNIKLDLGPQFFAQIEDLGLPNEHLHMQFNGE